MTDYCKRCGHKINTKPIFSTWLKQFKKSKTGTYLNGTYWLRLESMQDIYNNTK